MSRTVTDEKAETETALPRMPHVCEGCGALSTANGNPLDNRCRCSEGPRRRPLLVDELPTVDLATGHANVYAQRVKARHKADDLYLQLQAQVPHAEAALITCEEMGHDPRAGLCLRCGERLVLQDD